MGKLIPCLALFLITHFIVAPVSSSSSSTRTGLTNGFYRKTCPSAEAIVRSSVKKALAADPGILAALIRLHFHDCFVRGCDASILIDSTPANRAEKDSMGNKGVGGFEVIDEAKAALETRCPGTVSCADVIAFAARDSVFISGGLYYSVPAGRRDGRVSLLSDVSKNLPDAFFNTSQLKRNFARKGLSLDEMVTLSGAHSIGDSHCSSFSRRLYSFNATHARDPSLNAAYAGYLKTKCPRSPSGSGNDPLVSFDPVTPTKLDNRYYINLKSGKGLLVSDQVLWTTPLTKKMVGDNANQPGRWASKFAAAMVRMGSIDVITGTRGEIRKNCRVVN